MSKSFGKRINTKYRNQPCLECLHHFIIILWILKEQHNTATFNDLDIEKHIKCKTMMFKTTTHAPTCVMSVVGSSIIPSCVCDATAKPLLRITSRRQHWRITSPLPTRSAVRSFIPSAWNRSTIEISSGSIAVPAAAALPSNCLEKHDHEQQKSVECAQLSAGNDDKPLQTTCKILCFQAFFRLVYFLLNSPKDTYFRWTAVWWYCRMPNVACEHSNLLATRHKFVFLLI